MKQLTLIDFNDRMLTAWNKAFCTGENPVADPIMTFVHGDIREHIPAHRPDAFVTAGNSYGIMDGGIDLGVRELMPGVQETLLSRLHALGGFLPVGSTLPVPTGLDWCPILIYAPTMHVPEHVRGLNAFLAFHAALVEARRLGLENLMACGLATASGGFSHDACAKQMRLALDFMGLPPLPGTDLDGDRRGMHPFDRSRWFEATRRHELLQKVVWHG